MNDCLKPTAGSVLSRFKTGSLATLAAALATVLVCGCNSAKVTDEHKLSASPVGKPTTVYVANFDLDTGNIKTSATLLPSGRNGRLRSKLIGQTNDPEQLADKLVNEMVQSIVGELAKNGISAVRIAPGEPIPTEGWLTRGIFTQVQQGNRLQRAIIGFGLGGTDIQVVSVTDNLANGKPQPFYMVETDAASGKRPGAAATVMLSPVSVPVRFVIAGKDLDRNTKKTGAQIADSIIKKIQDAK